MFITSNPNMTFHSVEDFKSHLKDETVHGWPCFVVWFNPNTQKPENVQIIATFSNEKGPSIKIVDSEGVDITDDNG